MADVTVAADEVGAYEVALTANTAKSVLFQRDLSEVEVANLGGTTTVYVRLSPEAEARAATVAGAAGNKYCYPVYPNSVVTLPASRIDGNLYVSLISSGATTVWANGT
jgi:hypothetical protein